MTKNVTDLKEKDTSEETLDLDLVIAFKYTGLSPFEKWVNAFFII